MLVPHRADRVLDVISERALLLLKIGDEVGRRIGGDSVQGIGRATEREPARPRTGELATPPIRATLRPFAAPRPVPVGLRYPVEGGILASGHSPRPRPWPSASPWPYERR